MVTLYMCWLPAVSSILRLTSCAFSERKLKEPGQEEVENPLPRGLWCILLLSSREALEACQSLSLPREERSDLYTSCRGEKEGGEERKRERKRGRREEGRRRCLY